MRTPTRSAVALVALLAAASCGKSRPTPGAPTPVTVPAGGPGGGTVTVVPTSCTACHGEPGRLSDTTTNPLISSAPPRGVGGELTGRPVGAHDRHLRDGLSRALACANCHLVPGSSRDHRAQQHQNRVTFTVALPASDATWLGLSTGTPAWNGTSCSSTYCHGDFPGGNAATVTWQGGSAACGSCHGLPPTTIRGGSAHTSSTACGGCHGTGYTAAAVTGAAVATHVDGRVTLAGSGACDSCHGNPPTGPCTIAGTGTVHPPRSDCGSCHPGATSPGAGQTAGQGHQDGSVTLVTLSCTTCHGDAARSGNVAGTDARLAAAPPADITGAASGGTRIGAHLAHVNPPASGRLSAPIACTECHQGAMPPNPLHADGSSTVAFGTIALQGGITTAAYAGGSCSATWCHGNFPNGAGQNTISWSSGAAACGSCHALPPAGSHPVLAAGRACADCHTGYTGTQGGSTWGVNTALHVNGTVDGGGHPAGWDAADQHGLAAISFTGGNGGLAACTSCHVNYGNGNGTGAGVSSCNVCHSAVGHASWQTECTFCHGGRDSTTTGAPPRTTLVISADAVTPQPTTDRRIGAHTSHAGLGATPAETRHGLAPALSCDACHGSTPADLSHVDGNVPATFASVGGTPNPGSYSAASGCSANYCHGNFTGGAGSGAIAWTGTFGATGTLTCVSCHGNPPSLAAGHLQRDDCGTCHAGYSKTGATTGTVNVASHVNGTVDHVALTCTTCHGAAGRASQPGADANQAAAPPADVSGLTSGGTRIGAHVVHVNGTRSRPQACSTCHDGAVPTDPAHANGTVTTAFGAVGATAGTGTFAGAGGSCSATYCHGNFPGGNNSGASPAWTTAATLGCTSCHLAPPVPKAAGATPVSYHPNNTSCVDCHGTGYSATTVVQATHVDGAPTLVSGRTGCVACHGLPSRTGVAGADANLAAAPTAAASNGQNANAVGAHDAHVNSLAVRAAPLACAECHTVPATGDRTHANGSASVAFPTTGLARTGSFAASYAGGATPTCTVYCHSRAGASTPAPSWNATLTGCGTCHGAPPPTSVGHVQRTDCATCHGAGYTSSAVTGAALATHVNGSVELLTLTCTTCHGTTGRANTAALGPFDADQASAPPVDTTNAASGARVGAHLAHVNPAATGQTNPPVACTVCHPNNAGNNRHADGTLSVTFSGIAVANGAAPSWASGNCNASYCHGGTLSATTSRGNYGTWSWTSATAAACDSCHLSPPTTSGHSSLAHPSPATVCATCHDATVNTDGTIKFTGTGVNATTTHIDGTVQGGDCVACHGAGGAGTTGPNARRDVVAEFALTWSHKRSAGGTVTKWDCVVCHMEGDAATGSPSGVHADGVINLRDPDTGTEITTVGYTAASGSSPGSYSTAAGSPLNMTRFSRNLGSTTLEAAAQAIMIRQCLGCHDADGAASTLARVPTSVMPGASAAKPFGTTISGAAYTGAGITALGTTGGVVDVKAAFATTNASYHPILGQQNNWYAKDARMAAPWNMGVTTRTGTVNLTTWGPRITCWDCHAAAGATGTQTATVTAHGGSVTLRSPYWAQSTTAAGNLCLVCHVVATSGNHHGTGSAWASGGHSTPGARARDSCYFCHGSSIAKPARPIAAQDVHGFDAFAPAASATNGALWPATATDTYRPYGFMRNVTGSGGRWSSTSWKPLSGTSVPSGAATCGGTAALGTGCSSENHSSYTPGGTY